MDYEITNSSYAICKVGLFALFLILPTTIQSPAIKKLPSITELHKNLTQKN